MGLKSLNESGIPKKKWSQGWAWYIGFLISTSIFLLKNSDPISALFVLQVFVLFYGISSLVIYLMAICFSLYEWFVCKDFDFCLLNELLLLFHIFSSPFSFMKFRKSHGLVLDLVFQVVCPFVPDSDLLNFMVLIHYRFYRNMEVRVWYLDVWGVRV